MKSKSKTKNKNNNEDDENSEEDNEEEEEDDDDASEEDDEEDDDEDDKDDEEDDDGEGEDCSSICQCCWCAMNRSLSYVNFVTNRLSKNFHGPIFMFSSINEKLAWVKTQMLL